MSNSTLGELARQEICDAMQGLNGARAKEMALSLSVHHGVSVSRIYEISKAVRPKRKARSDKGKRTADLMEHSGLRLVAELVVNHNLKPELAIETARLNGEQVPVSQGTLHRYLRERGVNRRAATRAPRAHRRFEASAPGEIYQFDISGVKERWLDLKTRRILKVTELDVSKNHPNTKPNRVPLWKFNLVDDNSRFKYVRFFAVSKPNSMHVVEFLLQAFRELGVPKVLYSDNDGIIIGKRMQRAAAILDKAFESSGGFKLDQHLPGNPQATGKVERSHQIVEEFERLIGVKYTTPGIEELNNFAEWVCDQYNRKEHRVTREQPRLRFRAGNSVMRVPPPAVLDSAFKADEFTRQIRPDVSFSFGGVEYQLPRSSSYPFINWIGQTVTIVWPPDVDYYTVIGLDGTEYTVERKVARADQAGEFKAPAESIAQQTRKSLKASAADRKKALQETGAELLVPGFDSKIEADSVATFPRAKVETDPSLLAALLPGAQLGGQLIDYFTAIELLQEKEEFDTPPSAADQAWLKSVFGTRSEIEDTELWAALERRVNKPVVIDMLRRNSA